MTITRRLGLALSVVALAASIETLRRHAGDF